MKIKKKPVKPKKRTTNYYLDIYILHNKKIEDFEDIINQYVARYYNADLHNTWDATNLTYREFVFKLNDNSWDDSDEVQLVAEVKETDESYAGYLAQYDAEMKTYKKWYRENREAIIEEVANRKSKKILRSIKSWGLD